MARSNAEISKDLETVASWLTGARASKVLALSAELAGEAPPELTAQQVRDAERAERRRVEAEARAAAAAAAQANPEGDSALQL